MDTEQHERAGAAPIDSNSGYRRITGRTEFQAAVSAAIDRACRAGSLEMTWCDPNFAHWPLHDPQLLANLVRWGMPRRKLTLLAHDFDDVPKLFPGFVNWRRQWSHVVECRVLCDVSVSAVPTMLWVPGLECLRQADAARFTGIASSLPDDMNRVRESIEAVSQRSQPGFPATVLGL